MAKTPFPLPAIGRSTLLVILCLRLAALPAPAAAADAGSKLERLQDRARELDLSSRRTWQILLHYKRTLTGGYQSRISDPNFFLSPAGRSDPRQELEATLAGFFQPPLGDGEHAICRFPARLGWLAEELGIDPSALPSPSCSQQRERIDSIDARSAVLVFPVGHINSPASMFGHTLLRIDGSSRSSLISYAINYAADATDQNGFVYAYKGLCGKYKGYYSMMPYYLKVKEYSDLEHRDMWEYRLKLGKEEVERMLLHALELERIASEYYFLDENCSFNLLFLIEAARPTLHLSDRTGIVVLPTDTIHIARESGILEEAVYRPSQGARITRIASLLAPEEQQAALELARGERDPGSVRDELKTEAARRGALDLAAETLQLRYAGKELDHDAYSKLYLSILSERSALGKGGDELHALEPPLPPDAGHRSSKCDAGVGVRRGEWYGEAHLQPAFHDLLDPDQGYLRGAQIKFLDTALAYAPEQGRLWVKSLHLLDIVSAAPRDRFFKPFSWKVAAGWDTEPMRSGEDSLIFRINTGGGFSARTPRDGILYAFAELDLNAGKRLRGKVAAGPGVTLGILEQVTERWKVRLQGQAFAYPLGDERSVLKGTLAQSWRLSRNASLSLDGSFIRVNGHGVRDAVLLFNRYY